MNFSPDTRRRSTAHDVFAYLLISIYGSQVCPFVDTLTPGQIVAPLIGLFVVHWLAQQIVIPKILQNTVYEQQTTKRFQLEWFFYILAGLVITVFNTLAYQFPLSSGLKVFIGFLSIGFFVSLDLTLNHERKLVNFLKEKMILLKSDGQYIPLVTKFALFASMTLVFIVAIFSLLIIKDLDWLVETGSSIPIKQAQYSILLEFGFVGLIMISYTLLVIINYARNLNIFISNENQVLASAASGNLNVCVTVASNDELGEIAQNTNTMINTLNQRNHDIQMTQDITIMSLASLAETRDNETGAHILRTQNYVRSLALELQKLPEFSQQLDDSTIDLLYKSAPLHDIGKVGIPDAILLKPGKLTDDEFEIMKEHASLGAESLERAVGDQTETSFLRYAREIANSHHEKWNGSGYPQGLAGEDIPLSGRLMAVADVYDALISKRVYKPAFSHDKAMEIIQAGREQHFDPRIVDAMFRIEAEFVDIARRFSDHLTMVETG